MFDITKIAFLSSPTDSQMTRNNYIGSYLLTFQLQHYEVCLTVFTGGSKPQTCKWKATIFKVNLPFTTYVPSSEQEIKKLN